MDKLKEFLRKHNLPVSEIKAVLVSRVRDCLEQLFSRLNSMFRLFSSLIVNLCTLLTLITCVAQNHRTDFFKNL